MLIEGGCKCALHLAPDIQQAKSNVKTAVAVHHNAMQHLATQVLCSLLNCLLMLHSVHDSSFLPPCFEWN